MKLIVEVVVDLAILAFLGLGIAGFKHVHSGSCGHETAAAQR